MGNRPGLPFPAMQVFVIPRKIEGDASRSRRRYKLPGITRRELLLLVIGIDGGSSPSRGVSGITRLQKLIFLLDQEQEVRPEDGFDFEPYKAGPYSPKLYDDLELLENLGLIKSEAAAESTITETTDIRRVSFETSWGDSTK